MRLLWLVLVAILFAAGNGSLCAQPDLREGQELPQGLKLPIQAALSVRVLNITLLQETAGEIGAQVEFTQRWSDPTQRFDRRVEGTDHLDFVGAAAETKLQQIWSPGVVIENLIGSPRGQMVALSIYEDGSIVLLRRLDASFRVAIKMSGFPFETQRLPLRFVAPRNAANEVVVTTTEMDRRASYLSSNLSVINWIPKGISFEQDSFFGWNARPFSRVLAVVTLERAWQLYILRLFIPFAAVMSLSIFLLWAPENVLNSSHRSTMTFSALLALAALSFTFETSFPGVISMNSPVATMISMGYFYLPVVLTIDIFLGNRENSMAAKFPFLLKEIRRNARISVPLLFVGLCLLSLIASG